MNKIKQLIINALLILPLVVIPVLVFANPFHAQADTTTATELESIASDGTTPDGGSSNQSIISPDGRYVYFQSSVANLVPSDTNGADVDIFVRDRLTGTVSLLDLNSTGEQANTGISDFDVSDGGRYLVFSSGATNLVTPDYNNGADIYLRDLHTGITSLIYRNSFTGENSNHVAISGDGNWIVFQTQQPASENYTSIYLVNRKTLTLTRISNGTGGTAPNNLSLNSDINYDGSAIVFESYASNLVSSDTNGQDDIFLWQRATGSISRINVSSSGTQANNLSQFPHISGDGNSVVFASTATNLVSLSTTHSQVYLHQINTGATSLVSVNTSGLCGNSGAGTPEFSEDGNYVVFASNSSDLVSSDTNSGYDIFVRDLDHSSTYLVSYDPDGNQFTATKAPSSPVISADGQFVTFETNYGLSNTGVYLRY